MKNEEKIVELLAESLKGQDRIVAELKGVNQRLDQTNQRLDHLDVRVEKIEGHLAKLNIQTVENNKSNFSTC